MAGRDARPRDVEPVQLPAVYVRVAFLTALALAVLLLGAWAAEPASTRSTAIHTTTAVAGSHDREVLAASPVRTHVAARVRNLATALLALALVVALVGCRGFRRPPRRVPRSLSTSGRPPGRAPPALRIA